LVLSSLIAVSVISAGVVGQTTAKPSVPQFSATIIGDYYYVPSYTTTTIDQYTGQEKTITHPGYYKDERKEAIIIKNQPFTPYTDKDGNKYRLYYRAQVKGHFGDEWYDFSMPTFQSGSDYTTITPSGGRVPAAGSQKDYRVEAIIGQECDVSAMRGTEVVFEAGDRISLYTDVVSSGWSEVVTFTIPEPGTPSTVMPSNTPSTTLPNTLTPDPPTLEPSNSSPPPQLPWATYLLTIIATVCIITTPLVILAYRYGQRKTKTPAH
jgi:hypothetical protein